MRPTLNGLCAALFYVVPLAEALAFDGPRPTGLKYGQAIVGQAYRMPETPIQTTAPDIQHAQLFKRSHYETVLIAPDNTCGYFNGNASASLFCPTSYLCNLYLSFYSTESTSAGVLRCCPSTGVCTAALETRCIDSRAYYSSGSTCADNNCALCTSSSYPYCIGATLPAYNIKNFVCGAATASLFLTAAISYVNQFPPRFYVTSSYLAPDASTSTSSTAPPSSTTSNPSSTVTITPTVTQTPDPGPGTPVGPIVGGVVGGVVLIAAIVAFIFYMKKRNKRRAAENPAYPTVPLQPFPSPTDPKAPFTTQSSPVNPPYYHQDQGYQQPAPFYQQPGFQQQQPYGQQYSPTQQQYAAHPGTYNATGGSPDLLNKSPADSNPANRFSQVPTMASPNPQGGSRGERFEIEA